MSTTRIVLIAFVLFGSLGGLGCASEDFHEDGVTDSAEEGLDEAAVAPAEDAPLASTVGSYCKLFSEFRSAASARSYCYSYARQRLFRVTRATVFPIAQTGNGGPQGLRGFAVSCCMAR